MSAIITLRHLQSQADPDRRYARADTRRHIFSPGEPVLRYHQYVRSTFFASPAIIDMVHFLVVGPRGEGVGSILEYIQLIENPRSAMDPQDFFSNAMGALFFSHRNYRASGGELSLQLQHFFSNYANGTVRLRGPEVGTPSVSAETQARLVAHTSEAITVEQFLSFVRLLEAWLQRRR
jgi:hypothetical protein